MNMNALVMVTAHLESKDTLTRKFLNPRRKVTNSRKMASNFANFAFDLGSGLSDRELEIFASVNNDIESLGGEEKATVLETKNQLTTPDTQQASILPAEEIPEPSPTTEPPRLPQHSAETICDSYPQTTERSESEVEDRHTEAPYMQEIHGLDQIDLLLQKFDGGPHKGMKTRRFLRLCSALNGMGYFASFEANQKQVRIKTPPTEDGNPGVVTVMHTNHSNKSKDTGISRPTAEKLTQVIGILRETSQK